MISELLEIFFGSSGDPGLSVGTLISCVRQKLLDLYSAEVGPTVNFWGFLGYIFHFDSKFGELVPPKTPFFTSEMRSLGFFEVICKKLGMNPEELLSNFEAAKKYTYFVID